MTTKCETVRVTITDEAGRTSDHVMPAYTRPRTEFRDVILEHFDAYMERGDSTYAPVSVGDFALWLIGRAAQDPRYIES